MGCLSFSGKGWPKLVGAIRNPLANSQFWRCRCLLLAAAVAWLSGPPLVAQGLTVDTRSGREARPVGEGPHSAPVDRRYQQVTPTQVELPAVPMDAKSRILLMRDLQAEQGFAMRPFPKGHKGLTLAANGQLSPAGESYVEMVTNAGVSAKPGDRLVITDVKVTGSSIVLALNGGPDFKHRFLRHIQIGAGPAMTPVVQDTEPDPEGARLTLTFQGHLPAVNARQVKALLAPLISFDVKTPLQAFTDTLPKALREAILQHEVWVGMTKEMVLFAKGPPRSKSREMDGQMPFEEWIYGLPPEDVHFVRMNGNHVIRVEVARVGERPVIYNDDRVTGLMMSDGTQVVASGPKVHVDRVGDVQRDPDREAPAAPPSLRAPGEEQSAAEKAAAERSGQKNAGVMGPVRNPRRHAPDPALEPAGQPADGKTKQLWANPDEEQQEPAASQSAARQPTK